jgi:hypothetical protein
MGFKANMSDVPNTSNNNILPKKANPSEFFKIDLDLEETGYILNSMKSSTFRGDQLEKVFNLVMKLQNHYTNIKKND